MALKVGVDPAKPIRTEKDVVSFVQERRDNERLRYQAVWADWVENLAAFHGRPDLRVSDDFRLVKSLSPRQIREAERIVVNLVQPHVRTEAAKFQRSRPLLEAQPATSDEQDILAAKVGDRFLMAEWRQQGMDMRRLEKATWVAATGNAFWHLFFNPQAGPEVGEGVFLGQSETETLSPFKVVVEPHRPTIDRCRWAIVDQVLPIDEVQASYQEEYQSRTGKELKLTSQDSQDGKRVFGIGAQKTAGGSGFDLADLLATMIGAPGRNEQLDDGYLTVSVVYHMPTKAMPGGLYAIVAGDKVLVARPWPVKEWRSLPLFHFKGALCPWRFHGDTGATQVRQIQDIYLELRNLELDGHRDQARVKFLSPKGAMVDKDALLSRDPELIEYESIGDKPPPQRIQPAGPSPSIYQSIKLALEEANKASGLNEASQGTAPDGVTSGRAIALLQEQDDTRLASTTQLQEAEYGRWGSHLLSLVKNTYQEERQYSVAGDALGNAVWAFKNADLGSTSDVVCKPGSSLPQSKLARQENVMGLFKSGLLGDPLGEEARVRARRMLEFGLYEDLFDDDAADEGVAENENVRMLETARQLTAQLQQMQQQVQSMGQQVDPAMVQMAQQGVTQQALMLPSRWDNHMAHLKVHLRRLKQRGVRDEPALLALMEAHCDLHMQAMQPAPVPVGPDGQPVAAAGGEQAVQAQVNPNQTGGVATPAAQGGGGSPPRPGP